MSTYSLYGIRFNKISEKEAITDIRTALLNKMRTVIFTPNLQIIGKCIKDQQLGTLLNSADMLLPDGVGIGLLCRKQGVTDFERITGIDTAFSVLKIAEENRLKVFLLGGKPQIAQRAAEKLKNALPQLIICGTHHGYFNKEKNSAENKCIIEQLRTAKPDILFVCFGFPVQERWISENADQLPYVSLFMGLGGSLDVWSGKCRRAPKIFQRLHLEWLWRCLFQPKRFVSLFRNAFTVLFLKKQ